MGSHSDSEVDWDNEEEVWEDEVHEFCCLFCDSTFTCLKDLWSHCKEAHNFDFYQVKQQNNLDFYACIKLVNYIRSQVKEGKTPDLDKLSDILRSDEYMISVLPDDSVLFSLGDELDSDFEDDNTLEIEVENPADVSKDAEIKKLKLQNQLLISQLEEIRKDKMNELTSQTTDQLSVTPKKADNDSYYFESYAGNDIHFLMLNDSVRTEGYRDFVYHNKHIFAGKTVLDVGCGTGILSMFCAKAGAKKVYAVDNSDIIQMAISNAFENGLADQITFIRGKIEDISLPVDKVDIIISEWMGYALTFESMIDSVLVARDRFLAPSGIMAPSETRLVLTATTNTELLEEPIDFWSDVYGFKMNGMKDASYKGVSVQVVPQTYVNAKPVVFARFNMHTCKVQDVSFTSPFSLIIDNEGPLCAFTLWFDTYFTTTRTQPIPEAIDEACGFTTGPQGTPTHWKQCVLLLRNRPFLQKGTRVEGTISFSKNKKNNRDLDISVHWNVNGKADSQSYVLN